jgi:dienelactone hydrolase
VFLVTLAALAAAAAGAESAAAPAGDRLVAEYFRAETAALADRCLAGFETRGAWETARERYRRQLLEMLGLDPLPPRTDLKATVTGRVEHAAFTVENLHFQSRPGLYVTANLYLPRGLSQPAPAVLYLCGHAPAVREGISFGNKTVYHHHGGWLARHGYVCLILDTVQLGESQGIHHGTYREGMWWWNARGYTPAGVEAWNSIRALDYLQSRPEVDGERIGVTGRSGGGAYTWFLAALDDRVKVAVPVAGITDLENHVVDGCVSGHCDCMYLVNTYRWDYPLLAALVAPRPLLISNSDKDPIFPLEGVVRTHAKVRAIYRLYGAAEKLGLQITEGPHRDTQELRIHALTWFNRHLKEENPPIESAALPLFEAPQLKVFDRLPDDAENAQIQESFVPAAAPEAPATVAEWARQRDGWMAWLRERVFGGWPETPEPLAMSRLFSVARDGLRAAAYDFTSQSPFRLRLYVLQPEAPDRPKMVLLRVPGEAEWQRPVAAVRHAYGKAIPGEAPIEAGAEAFAALRETARRSSTALAFVAVRGVGPTAWTADEKARIHVRRRFMLLGQTLDGMRVWDVRRALQALAGVEGLSDLPVGLEAGDSMAGIALYAVLFEPRVARLELRGLPRSHREGPDFLNVLRALDVPQAVAMAAERRPVRLIQETPEGWEFPAAVAARLGWKAERLAIERPPAGSSSGVP